MFNNSLYNIRKTNAINLLVMHFKLRNKWLTVQLEMQLSSLNYSCSDFWSRVDPLLSYAPEAGLRDLCFFLRSR